MIQQAFVVLLLQAAVYAGPKRNILIDVGTADNFLENQLKPDDFCEAAASNEALEVQLRKQVHPKVLRATISALTARHAGQNVRGATAT